MIDKLGVEEPVPKFVCLRKTPNQMRKLLGYDDPTELAIENSSCFSLCVG